MNQSRWLLAVTVVSVVSCGPGKTMMVDRKPVAEFKFTQSTVRPQVFVFDAAQSRATVGTLAKFRWTFGDEAMGDAPTEVPTSTAQHSYKMAGTFTVTLIVLDDKDAASDPVTQTVTVATVNTEGPMAKITGPSSGMPSMQLTFDGSTSTPTGDIQNYAWDFGDGTTSAGKDKTIVQHSFATANRFRVTLTVTDSLGQNNTTELQVAIGDVGPVAVCAYTPQTGITQGAPVTFNGSGSTAPSGTTIIAHQWFPGEPGSDAGTGNPFGYAYRTQGTFQPKLKVFDSMGRSHETFCSDVTVGAPSLCMGNYSLQANPTMNAIVCGGIPIGTATWAGVQLGITQTAPNVITSTEQFQGMTLTYAGTFTGNSFTMTGSFTVTSMAGDEDHDVKITGMWTNGCNGWSGTYEDTVTVLGLMCTKITWNVTSMKL